MKMTMAEFKNMTKEEIKNSAAFEFILNYLKNNDLFYTGDDDYINEKVDEIIEGSYEFTGGKFELFCAYFNKTIKDRYYAELIDIKNKVAYRNKIGKKTLEQLDSLNEQNRYYADRVSKNLSLCMRGVRL